MPELGSLVAAKKMADPAGTITVSSKMNRMAERWGEYADRRYAYLLRNRYAV